MASTQDDLFAVFLTAQHLAMQEGHLALYLAPVALQETYWREAIRLCNYRTNATDPVAVEPLDN